MLETKQLTKHFKGLSALNNLNLTVGGSEIVGLIGPNGAGKTTTFNVITGFLKPSSGKVYFEGQDITGKPPHAIAKCGIVKTFQLDRIFHEFTVFQNMLTASHIYANVSFLEAILRTRGYQQKMKRIAEEAYEILRTMNLEGLQNEPAKNLSHGHQRMLGVALALVAHPKLLLLDEPLAGMTAVDINKALELIAAIKQQGISVLLIEHNMEAVMRICDRIIVLNFGNEICRGTCQEVVADPKVIQAYLGEQQHVA